MKEMQSTFNAYEERMSVAAVKPKEMGKVMKMPRVKRNPGPRVSTISNTETETVGFGPNPIEEEKAAERVQCAPPQVKRGHSVVPKALSLARASA